MAWWANSSQIQLVIHLSLSFFFLDADDHNDNANLKGETPWLRCASRWLPQPLPGLLRPTSQQLQPACRAPLQKDSNPHAYAQYPFTTILAPAKYLCSACPNCERPQYVLGGGVSEECVLGDFHSKVTSVYPCMCTYTFWVVGKVEDALITSINLKWKAFECDLALLIDLSDAFTFIYVHFILV